MHGARVTLAILQGLLDATQPPSSDTSDWFHAAGCATVDGRDVHVAPWNQSVFQAWFPDDLSAGSAQRGAHASSASTMGSMMAKPLGLLIAPQMPRPFARSA